jgi:hypothetical protein
MSGTFPPPAPEDDLTPRSPLEPKTPEEEAKRKRLIITAVITVALLIIGFIFAATVWSGKDQIEAGATPEPTVASAEPAPATGDPQAEPGPTVEPSAEAPVTEEPTLPGEETAPVDEAAPLPDYDYVTLDPISGTSDAALDEQFNQAYAGLQWRGGLSQDVARGVALQTCDLLMAAPGKADFDAQLSEQGDIEDMYAAAGLGVKFYCTDYQADYDALVAE